MDVLLRVKPSEIKVDDLFFSKGDLTRRPWRVQAIVRSTDYNNGHDYIVFSVNDGDRDRHVTLREPHRYIVSREMKVMQADGSLL